ncbi:penicillin-binding protein 2 [Gloeothece citriformis PCC 7424]|uniref:Penicillin-binding protein 2 n=1 Tax=Gloeothece citriformis (strain PCC 7424) TaxID=65393 RepID=B7K8V3_GLOC7|nr:penicillin-binding protein 2 [Gloeothece citriformis]ACK71301.1 penicillin-binding protein 2 [Gloeothece citriformis PCC 7424]
MRTIDLLPKPKPKNSHSRTRISQPSFAQDKRKETGRTVGRQYQSVLLMILISIVLLGGVGARLFYLQLSQGEVNREKAENNRIRIVPKQPVRGNLFDRKGRVLATTRLTHAAYLWPMAQKRVDWQENIRKIAQLLGVPQDSIEEKVEQAGFNSPTLIRIARSLTPAQITAIEEYRSEINGVEVDIETVRHYPHGKMASHVMGYTGELNAEELARRRKDGYRMGDVVGQMGVEAAFEPLLRGEWGGLQLEVDGAGKVMRVLGQKEAKPGKDVTLTLDLEVQKAAEAALGNRKGAVVALDPRDGSVLAMVSYPRFNPNVFSSQITPQIWKELQETKPFVNRAMRGFPPASTFKVVTQTAGMETGKYPPNTILSTFAYLNVGGMALGEWNRAGFGPMGYVRAMAWSSNTFHGQIGRGVGGPTLIKYSRLYGFGQETGIELSEESPGLIADDAWKRKMYNWEWTDGDTVNMSIGQGFTQATPLQVAVMFAVPANGGYKVKPHLFKDSLDNKDKWRTSLNFKPSTIKILREGLRAVVSSGTGKALNVPHLPPVAGKSGTAEAPPGKSHAWFGAFAPYDNPEIVVVAFAEHSGGGGGSVAAPMVRQVMEAYFKAKPPKN